MYVTANSFTSSLTSPTVSCALSNAHPSGNDISDSFVPYTTSFTSSGNRGALSALATFIFTVPFSTLKFTVSSGVYLTANELPSSPSFVAFPTGVLKLPTNAHPSGNCPFTSSNVCPYIAFITFNSGALFALFITIASATSLTTILELLTV